MIRRNSNRKMTLESRIARLEKLLKTSRKFESLESDLDESGARAKANRIAQQFGRMIGEKIRPDDLGRDTILSPLYGWLNVDAVDEIMDDSDARFAFQYSLGNTDFDIIVFPTENSVELCYDSLAIDPSGDEFEGDNSYMDAFPLNDWEGFSLSMVHDEYDESVKRRRCRSCR